MILGRGSLGAEPDEDLPALTTDHGTDDEEFRVEAVKDRTDTTMQAWMGLTFGCAKCHTHKYDPISIDEYYSVFAFFNAIVVEGGEE